MKWSHCDIRQLSPEDYARGYGLMSRERQERVDAARFQRDRKRAVAGHLLACTMIAEWCQAVPETLCIAYTQLGKPFVRDLPVEFSISHSGDLAVCAVDSRPVGIDVERLRPVDLTVAKKICDPEELRYLFGKVPADPDFVKTEDPGLLERFFRLWTGKEACAKRIGEGIGALHRCHPLREKQLHYTFYEDYLICISCSEGGIRK